MPPAWPNPSVAARMADVTEPGGLATPRAAPETRRAARAMREEAERRARAAGHTVGEDPIRRASFDAERAAADADVSALAPTDTVPLFTVDTAPVLTIGTGPAASPAPPVTTAPEPAIVAGQTGAAEPLADL